MLDFRTDRSTPETKRCARQIWTRSQCLASVSRDIMSTSSAGKSYRIFYTRLALTCLSITYSPTRSSLLSGRLPIHVNQNNANNDARAASGIDLRMTTLPQKLKAAGNWRTAMVGKWHCGARSSANLPINRGFDHHFGFLKGGEDHFEQNHCAGGPGAKTVDL